MSDGPQGSDQTLASHHEEAGAEPESTIASEPSLGLGALPSWTPPVLVTLLALGVWEGLARTHVLPPELPPFSAAIRWLIQAFGTSAFWLSLGDTMGQWAVGLIVGTVVGAVLGVGMGAIPLLGALLQTPFEFLRPIPAVVYLPLMILVLGSTSQVGIILVATATVWPMVFQTFYGVQAIDPMTLETARMFGLNRRDRLLRVTVPSVLPFVATGIRISASLALVVAVSIELVGGVPGLGADLAVYGRNSVYDAIYAIIIVAGSLGFGINVLVQMAERRLLRWHVSQRSVTQ